MSDSGRTVILVGKSAPCRGCGRPVLVVKTVEGRWLRLGSGPSDKCPGCATLQTALTTPARRPMMVDYDAPRAAAGDLQGEPGASAASGPSPHGVVSTAWSPALILSASLLFKTHPKPKPPPPQEGWVNQIVDAVLAIVLTAFEWIFSTIMTIGQFLIGGYLRALTTGQPWALILAAALVGLAAWGMLSPGGDEGRPGKWCGTCGGKGRRHKDWCKGGRWGGSQRWRND